MGDFYRLSQVAIAAAEEGHGEHGGHIETSIWGFFFFLTIVLVLMLTLMASAKKSFGERVFKNAWAQRSEQLYLFIENMCVGTIGSHGRRFVPMVMTFWLVIFFSNIVALFFGTSPTSILGFNVGMALIAIGTVQWEGIKQNGVFGHFSHFAGPKLGGPLVLISLMIFVIEIISEVMKNVSLSLRLYGNIDGGHKAVVAMNDLGTHMFGSTGIPFGEFLIPIKLLTCLVQAMIFCLLLCVYISLVTHDEADHHGEPVTH
jgi:F-type H+-transporting ATPase subunit a